MSNDWKSKCTFLNPQNAAVDVAIREQTLRFYPVSVGKLFELRAIAQPLTAALMTLMTDTSTDSGVHRSVTEGGTTEESIMPPSPEILDIRRRHQTEAIKELTDALTSPQNLGIVGGLLVDSLRDLFPPGSKDNPPGIEFINSLNASDLPAFIKGLAKANKGVLGDFGGKTMGLLDGVIEKVKAKTETKIAASSTANEEQTEKPNATG